MSTLEQFAVWSTAYVNDLPDSAFLYIESGGEKDSDGKTTPRSLRHFPYKDANGKVDLPHLRNALARIPQSNLPADVKKAVTAKAEKILAQNGGSDNDGDETARTLPAELFSAVVPLTHVEVCDTTATGNGTYTMSGYAAVFNQQAVFLDSQFLKLKVQIAADAFDRVLNEQGLNRPDGVVHFNLGHDMNRAVAATDVPIGQPGSLELRPDAHGLRYFARVSKDDPDGVALATKMRDGVIRQASMAFVAAENHYETFEHPDGTVEELRTIQRVGTLYDVCACAQGAFPQTVSQLQMYAASLGRTDLTSVGQRVAAGQPGSSQDRATQLAAGQAERRRELAKYRRDLARIRK